LKLKFPFVLRQVGRRRGETKFFFDLTTNQRRRYRWCSTRNTIYRSWCAARKRNRVPAGAPRLIITALSPAIRTVIIHTRLFGAQYTATYVSRKRRLSYHDNTSRSFVSRARGSPFERARCCLTAPLRNGNVVPNFAPWGSPSIRRVRRDHARW